MTFTEEASFSSIKNLYYVDKRNHIELYDTEGGKLGKFEVWHDSENENKEYITLNKTRVYLDDIHQQ